MFSSSPYTKLLQGKCPTIIDTEGYRNPDTALTELWETLERLKITPKHRWKPEQKQLESVSAIKDRIPLSVTMDECQENLEYNIIKKDENEGEDAEDLVEELPDIKQRRLFEDCQNEDRKDKPPSSVGNLDGRLDRALEFARLRSQRPEDRSSTDIQNAIVNSLKKCPNYSCTLKSLTSRVLKELGVLTRGNPRLEFERRIIRNLGVLKRKGIVEEYKARNKRIRLLV